MHICEHQERAKMVIDLLLSVPFPFPFIDIIKKQIDSSIISSIENEYYYCLSFEVVDNSHALPLWMDTIPLSWQVPGSNTPHLFQLFIHNCYIEKLEIINMGLNSLEWDRIFHTMPIYDFEFDLHRIRTFMCNSQLLITNVLCYGPSVDFMVKSENDNFVASFRCCEPEITNFQVSLAPCYFEIYNTDASKLNIVVRQKNKTTVFTSKFMFLRWNTIIG